MKSKSPAISGKLLIWAPLLVGWMTGALYVLGPNVGLDLAEYVRGARFPGLDLLSLSGDPLMRMLGGLSWMVIATLAGAALIVFASIAWACVEGERMSLKQKANGSLSE